MNNQTMLIGAGFHCQTNILPSLKINQDNVCALACTSTNKANKTLNQFGFQGKAFDDYSTMLEEIDCNNIIIVSNATAQLQMCKAAITYHKNIFVEKPLGTNLEEAIEIAELVKNSSAKIMIGYMKRYAASYQKLKQIIQSQELGKVIAYQCYFNVDATKFCPTLHEYIIYVLIHYLDLLHHLFGTSTIINNSKISNPHINLNILFNHRNGVIGSGSFASTSAYSREEESITVTFEQGFVKTINSDQVIVHNSITSPDELSEMDITYSPTNSVMTGVKNEIVRNGYVGEIAAFFNNDYQSYELDNIEVFKLVQSIMLSN